MIVGFVDGTRKPLCRPFYLQQSYYNGWLHNHTLLFIAICFPDGTFLLRGPVGGHNNDIHILESSGLCADLPRLFRGYAIGGDGIFPTTAYIHPIEMFDRLISPMLRKAYSSVRIAVEWLFNDITNHFQFLALRRKQHVWQTQPAMMYKVGAVLALARNCLYGNEISDHFQCQSPTLSTVFPKG